MATDFVYGLLPDLLLLVLIVVLMLLEMLRADARWARVAFIAVAVAALGHAAGPAPGRLHRRAHPARGPRRFVRGAGQDGAAAVRTGRGLRLRRGTRLQVLAAGGGVDARRHADGGERRLCDPLPRHRIAVTAGVRADRARARTLGGQRRRLQVPRAVVGRERAGAVRHLARLRAQRHPADRSPGRAISLTAGCRPRLRACS